MWARTLCPLSSSTLKKALGSDSTTVPSISMAPSFLGISSALHCCLLVSCLLLSCLLVVLVLVVPVLVVPGTGWLSRCRLVRCWLLGVRRVLAGASAAL